MATLLILTSPIDGAELTVKGENFTLDLDRNTHPGFGKTNWLDTSYETVDAVTFPEDNTDLAGK